MQYSLLKRIASVFSCTAAGILILLLPCRGFAQPLSYDSTLTNVTVDGKPRPACLAGAFYQMPDHPDLFVGRTVSLVDRSKCTGPTPYALALFRMDWQRNNLQFDHLILPVPVIARGGIHVTNALDPAAVSYHGETWIAFECTYLGMTDNSNCLAPYNSQTSMVDLSRLTIPVMGTKSPNAGNNYSASDPKLYANNGRIYLYWTVVNHVLGGAFTNLRAKGVELKLDGGVLHAVGSTGGGAISSVDGDASEVIRQSQNDSRKNVAADIFDVKMVYGKLLAAVAVGGTGDSGEESCTDPSKRNRGCYHLELFAASQPLGMGVFNEKISNDQSFPYNPVAYTHFITKPNGSTALIEILVSPAMPDSGHKYAPAGLTMVDWPGFQKIQH